MQRIQTVLLSILLGAIAVGIGMGIFLKKANDDRARLEQAANQAAQQSKTAAEDRERTVNEANKRIEEANTQISQNQEQLKVLTAERDAIANAKILSSPLPKLIKGWKEQVILDQSMTIKLPTSELILESSTSSFSTGSATTTYHVHIHPITSPMDWSATSSTPAVFVVDGHLLIGEMIPNDDGIMYRLTAQKNGVKTHFIEIIETPKNKSWAELVLSTIKFAQ